MKLTLLQEIGMGEGMDIRHLCFLGPFVQNCTLVVKTQNTNKT